MRIWGSAAGSAPLGALAALGFFSVGCLPYQEVLLPEGGTPGAKLLHVAGDPPVTFSGRDISTSLNPGAAPIYFAAYDEDWGFDRLGIFDAPNRYDVLTRGLPDSPELFRLVEGQWREVEDIDTPVLPDLQYRACWSRDGCAARSAGIEICELGCAPGPLEPPKAPELPQSPPLCGVPNDWDGTSPPECPVFLEDCPDGKLAVAGSGECVSLGTCRTWPANLPPGVFYVAENGTGDGSSEANPAGAIPAGIAGTVALAYPGRYAPPIPPGATANLREVTLIASCPEVLLDGPVTVEDANLRGLGLPDVVTALGAVTMERIAAREISAANATLGLSQVRLDGRLLAYRSEVTANAGDLRDVELLGSTATISGSRVRATAAGLVAGEASRLTVLGSVVEGSIRTSSQAEHLHLEDSYVRDLDAAVGIESTRFEIRRIFAEVIGDGSFQRGLAIGFHNAATGTVSDAIVRMSGSDAPDASVGGIVVHHGAGEVRMARLYVDGGRVGLWLFHTVAVSDATLRNQAYGIDGRKQEDHLDENFLLRFGLQRLSVASEGGQEGVALRAGEATVVDAAVRGFEIGLLSSGEALATFDRVSVAGGPIGLRMNAESTTRLTRAEITTTDTGIEHLSGGGAEPAGRIENIKITGADLGIYSIGRMSIRRCEIADAMFGIETPVTDIPLEGLVIREDVPRPLAP